MQARRRPPLTGSEQMIGMAGRVVEWDGLTGSIRVHGETWRARADIALAPGDPISVVSREGLMLTVRPITTTGETHA